MRIVMKFGGTSLSDGERLRNAALRAVERRKMGDQVVVVVSAQGHTTDRLAAQAAAFCPNPREWDVLLSAGEQMSAALMAMAIGDLGVEAESVLGWQMGLVTDDVHGNAEVLSLRDQRIEKILSAGKIAVAAGFQGVTGDGNVTTLGRGGSDTTAVALAAYLNADICLIYTDVDGIYDRDPRLFPDAKKYARLDYDAALSLALSGAQVLHSRCIEIGKRCGVPIRVLSSFRGGEGTLVN